MPWAVIFSFMMGSAAVAGAANDHPPVLRVPISPTIPPELHNAAQLKGFAIVEFVVGTDGKVTDAKVRKTSNPVFGQAAVEAVLRWRYSPGARDGHPVVTKIEQRLEYDLTAATLPGKD